MTAYEIMKARHELEEKKRELRAKVKDANEAMRAAYKVYCAADADIDNFSDDEVDELGDIYEARCETVNELEEQMETLEHAIEVFGAMETVVDELFHHKIWEG